MYKIIEVNNKIFESEEFQKDKYLFNILMKKVNAPTARIMSDENNYIITNESMDTAPWIWTKDNFDKSILIEIKELIKKYLVKDQMTFTCKKELYELLLHDNFELIHSQTPFELGFMKCEKLIDPKQNDGVLDRVKIEEKDIIAKFMSTFEKSMDDSVTNFSQKKEDEIIARCLEKAEEEINNDKFYVLRNHDGKIVSMAHYILGENNTAKIGLVYTPDEERGKGYAAKLVHDLTKMVLDKGYIPILYTDQNYPSSNKAYANVGYVNCGTLVSFMVSRKR